MLSILIPTYNYNVYPLAKELHKQFSKLGVEFEIRIYEDASIQKFETNDLLKDLDHIVYKSLKKNLGRTKLRHLLATEAQYNQLLFIDADMFPKDRFYATKTLKVLERVPANVHFGGIQVPPSPPSPKKILRWKYGKEREALPLEQRRKNPYRSIISSHLLIKKEVFLQVSNKIKDFNRYGLDIYFSYLLKKQKAKVYHYNNPLMHLGLEDSDVFIKKTQDAVETLYFLIKNSYIPRDYSKLGKLGLRLKKFKLCGMLSLLFHSFNKICLKNLLSTNPSLGTFDLYKLCYFCKISQK